MQPRTIIRNVIPRPGKINGKHGKHNNEGNERKCPINGTSTIVRSNAMLQDVLVAVVLGATYAVLERKWGKKRFYSCLKITAGAG